MQKFWWGPQANESLDELKKMGISKKKGGMRFRDLHCFNQALFAKQCWRFLKMRIALFQEL
jgi:hypothetical protein